MDEERDYLETIDVVTDAMELTQTADPGMIITEVITEELVLKPLFDFLEKC